MDKQLDVNPWLRIWIAPRDTIRKIVEFNPKLRLYVLSTIYGIPLLLHLAQNLSLGQGVSLLAIVIGTLILSMGAGLAVLSACSGLIFWTGKWIGGKGSFQAVRAALAWSYVTDIVSIVLWGVLISVFKQTVFLQTFPQTVFVGRELSTIVLVSFVQFIIAVWAFVILLKALGEVQGFSAWKALLNLAIPFFVLSGVVWTVFLVLGLFA